ncbi:putative gluconokinase isoform X2 [Lithobates pipiens]
MIVVIMGVSGCGKTEVGSQLANKDRQPWLCKLHNLITSDEARGHHVVLACSALKKAYRETLATGTNLCTSDRQQQENLDPDIFFIHLQGSQKLISERIQKRTGHFMPVDLLASQFDTLEPPTAPEHFMTVNVEKDISQIVSEIQGVLEGKV